MIKWMILFFVSFSAYADFPHAPDPSLTTGSVCTPSDRDFQNYRYQERIPYCRRSVSKSMKNRVYEAYGINPRCKTEYTVDHLIPLSIGGSNSFRNLWPEHHHVKATRLHLEEEVFDALRKGEITQAEAIQIIVEEKTNPPANIPPSNCH